MDVKAPDAGPREVHVHVQARTPGEVDDHARERFVQRHIGMAIAANALLVADGASEGLAKGNADIFHRVVVIDVQIALAMNVQVDQPVPGDLVQHVLEKGDANIEVGLAGTVQVDLDFDLRLQRVALDACLALRHGSSPVIYRSRASIIRAGCVCGLQQGYWDSRSGLWARDAK